MSTDMQKYSIESQIAAIAIYAAQRNLNIVRSYADAGRSGLRLDGRDGLKSLINDVKSGAADFKIILVYDVSRWGRFQDSDESAHYEYLCRQAGITVQYCAEEFENDGSLMATIVKNIKRAMAAEFSRELSVKVHAGQSRIVAKGFHVGGRPGYGLRRLLLDENREKKFELLSGQQKSLHTEHTILVPGPPEEVEALHRVYRLFVDERKSLNEIVRILNRQGMPNAFGRTWSSASVRDLLANEKYMGSSVYNRTPRKLGTKSRRNPKSEWVRKAGAFEAIVSPERFARAQHQLKEGATPYADSEMLNFLTALWCQKGHLSVELVEASEVGPSATAYKKHFGSLLNAFRTVGFISARTADRENLLNIRKTVRSEIESLVRDAGGTVEIFSGWSCQLRINGSLNVTIIVGRAAPASVARNQNEWRFEHRSLHKPDILIVARVDHGSSTVRDYYVLPYLFLPAGTALTVSGRNYKRLETFHTGSLAPFCRLCAMRPLDA